MNDFVTNGVFKITVQGTTLNIPYTTAQTLYLKVETCWENRLVQTITSYNDHTTWRRTRQNNKTWDAWQSLDNFGCNTAAELASLLGAVTRKGVYIASASTYAKIPMFVNARGFISIGAGYTHSDLLYFSSAQDAGLQHNQGIKIKRLVAFNTSGAKNYYYSVSENSLYYTQQYGGDTLTVLFFQDPNNVSLTQANSLPSDSQVITVE